MTNLTPKQRMLNAYRGIPNDRPAAAPEFWYYYPAKLLGVDMIEFERNVPFHQALKTAFTKFKCEGWGLAFAAIPNDNCRTKSREIWLDRDTLEKRYETITPRGKLVSAVRSQRDEPSWVLERPVKNLARDLPAWEIQALGGEPEKMDVKNLIQAWREVGESYLLEAYLGMPFFDFFAAGREGAFEAAVGDFFDKEREQYLLGLQQRYKKYLLKVARAICEKTPIESLCIGCSWSCNSLIGPNMWRQWDKPVIKALAEEIHRQGRLLHVHFHGRCLETAADFAELDIDCVCPFERPPGGDVAGRAGLQAVARALKDKTTMNGNVHTVDTLIRGTPADVRREVAEIRETFAGNPRLIIGTGDQVGRETPEENLQVMIAEAQKV